VALSTIVLIMTAHGTIRSAVEAFRSGAHDYLVKPFSLREMGETIANVIQYHRLIRENSIVRQEVRKELQSHPLLVGKSQAMRELTRLILNVAPPPPTC
jgi:DNA-binding NtrC family response regulator